MKGFVNWGWGIIVREGGGLMRGRLEVWRVVNDREGRRRIDEGKARGVEGGE